MKKLALFDFDKTVLSVDSVVEFRNFLQDRGYTVENFDRKKMNLNLPNEIINFLNKLNWLEVFKGKNRLFFNTEVDLFVQSVLLKKTISPVLNELLKLQQNGFEVVFISASYRQIIERFCFHMNLINIKIICTELKFNGEVFSSELDGLNCSGINKLVKLKNTLNLDEYDMNEAYAFTDHITDLSILLLVKNRVVVHLPNTLDDWSHLFNVNYITVK